MFIIVNCTHLNSDRRVRYARCSMSAITSTAPIDACSGYHLVSTAVHPYHNRPVKDAETPRVERSCSDEKRLMYYHVYIELTAPEGGSEVKLGLTEDEFRRRILRPYDQGTSFVVNGRAILADNVKRLSVRRGTTPIQQLLAIARMRERASSVVVLGHDMVPYEAFLQGDDVTDEYVQGPPGWRRSATPDAARMARVRTAPKAFVRLRAELAIALESFAHEIEAGGRSGAGCFRVAEQRVKHHVAQLRELLESAQESGISPDILDLISQIPDSIPRSRLVIGHQQGGVFVLLSEETVARLRSCASMIKTESDQSLDHAIDTRRHENARVRRRSRRVQRRKSAGSAQAACKRLGKEWASIAEFTRLLSRSDSSIRSRIHRCLKRLDEKNKTAFEELNVRRLPSPQAGMPRQEYRIEGIWPLLFPNVRNK
ncbi:MAG: hypothetical protein L6R00_19155 [Phycisphaerae bacterium]|nr:hypothetical protein [Phycisphaerae bacterium]